MRNLPDSRSPCAPRHRWHGMLSGFILLGCFIPEMCVGAPDAASSLPVLTQARQVLELSAAEAARGYPVELEGVITYADAGWGLLFVQDATAGIYVHQLVTGTLRSGQRLALKGATGAGLFAPILASTNAQLVGEAPLPEAKPIEMAELNVGTVDSQRVELLALVQDEEEVSGHLRLTLRAGRNRCQAWVLQSQGYAQLQFPGSWIRIRGVAASRFDSAGLLEGFQLYVPNLADIEIVEHAQVDPFARPVTLSRELFRFDAMRGREHRLRVAGIVTSVLSEQLICVRDSTGSFGLQTARQVSVRPGDQVEAVGFREGDPRAPRLEAAVVRVTGRTNPPTPLQIEATRTAGRLAYELVEADGELLSFNTSGPSQLWLTVKEAQQSYIVFLQATNTASLAAKLSTGCQVRVVGVVQPSDSSPPGPSRVALWARAPEDIQVVAAPRPVRRKWRAWTWSALGAGLLFGAGPMLWVHWRSRQRSAAILQEHRRHLRQHVEERERISKDLHDNIMQSIYAVGLGLEDCRRLLARSVTDAEERLASAIRALNSVLQDVRQFIGGLEPRVVSGAELKTALKSLALTAGETNGRILIQADPNATGVLTPHQATHLLNIAKEAMSNSLRHARAPQTTVALLMAGDHVRLEVSDDGIGFDPRSTTAEGNGLRNVAARARELGARVEVISAPGEGTRLLVDLPPLKGVA